MENILVPCDFSKPAIHAFDFAANVAEKSDAIVHLVHVIEPPLMNDTFLMPTLYFEEEILKDLKENAEDQFRKLEKQYASRKLKMEWHVELGLINAILIDFIQSQNIDLVIMGSHGASGLKEAFAGSHAEKLVRTSPVPVIVLKDKQSTVVKNIVFPNSLELEDQEDLVLKVKALQDFFGAHLNLVWINTPLNFTSDTVTRERLSAFAQRYQLTNYSIHVFNYADSERGIIHFTKLTGGDMIAMGTHGRRGLSHLFNGSMTEDVVNHVKCPIWTSVMKSDRVLNEENAR